MLHRFLHLFLIIMLASCEKDEETQLPIITTDHVVVTLSKAFFKGSITEVNGRQLSDYGFLWDDKIPTLENSFQKSLGQLTSDLTFIAELNAALHPDKVYFVRSYYVMKGNVFYGESVSFQSIAEKIPVIDSFAPATATWGDTIVIQGKNFSPIANENLIRFGQHPAVCITADGEMLKTVVPSSLDIAQVALTVTILDNQSNAENLFVLKAPVIESFTPETGRKGTEITISGKYFKEGITRVYFDSLPAFVTSIAANTVVARVPGALPDGSVRLSLYVAEQHVTSPTLFISQALVITELTPLTAAFDEVITIHGSGFSDIATNNKVAFGETPATVTEATYHYLKVSVPRALTRSQTQLQIVNGNESVTSVERFSLRPPSIISFSLGTGTFRDGITITGENFNPLVSGNQVLIGGVSATITEATASTLRLFVPDGFSAPDGRSRLKVGVADLSVESESVFELTPHSVLQVGPQVVERNDVITIAGQFFNPVAEHNEVFFGSIRATVASATTSLLLCTVPSGLTRGEYTARVRVGGREVTSSQTFLLDDPWAIKDPVGGGARKHGFTFVIQGKAYAGGGFGSGSPGNYKNDMYTFHPEANSWTKKGQIPVNGEGMVEFCTATKGYLLFSKELWQYDPVFNQWARKADYPGDAVRFQSAFGIGDKGYAGTGAASWGSPTSEFYEYNEAQDKWLARPSCPAGAMWFGVGFSVGEKGYFATGSWAQRDLWEFDPSTNQWRNILSLLGIMDRMNNMRLYAVGISGNSKAYIATGTDDSAIWGGLFNDLYEFDPVSNSVIKLPNIPGLGRVHAFGFNLDGKVYIGGGLGRDEDAGFLITFDDIYEYSPKD